MTPGYTLSSFARLLLGLLERCGVSELVTSPGSRSTPYLIAAQRHSTLSLHSVVDERSAAYVALGLSRGSGKPVALLCTSGTAAANYLPAVVEARLTATPLVVLTADRPLGLYDCAAPQTIDQRSLYGNHVAGSWSLTPPSAERDEWAQLKRLILSALARSTTGPEPGPIHFNLHSPKPLEAIEPQDSDDQKLEDLVTVLLAEPQNPPLPGRSCPSDDSLERVARAVEREANGLITVGFDPEEPALDPMALTRFARTSGYPVLIDASHPLRFSCPAELSPYVVAPFEPLLRLTEWQKAQSPRLVVQLGRPLTASAWERWLDGLRPAKLLLVARRGWPDPSAKGTLVANADPTEFLSALSERLEAESPRSSGWQARWLRASEIVGDLLSRALAAQPIAATPSGRLDELVAVHAVLRALPDESRLVVGNSLPIRHLDFLAAKSLTTRLSLYSLRGASGIDGITSTAVGVARTSDAPTTLLVGDISFLHDIGGLWAAQELPAPLAVVVLNNGGGRIFEQLPISRVATSSELVSWTTPQNLDLSHAAALYGLAYLQVRSSHGIVDALREAHAHPRATVIDVMLVANSAKAQATELVARIGAELEQQGLLNPPSGVGQSLA